MNVKNAKQCNGNIRTIQWQIFFLSKESKLFEKGTRISKHRRKDIVQERKENTIEAVHAIRSKCKSKADVVESADWKPSNVKLRNTCSPKRLHSNRFRAFAASCSRCLLEETFSFRVRERIRSIDQNCRRPSNARESIVPLPRYNNKANTRNVLDH